MFPFYGASKGSDFGSLINKTLDDARRPYNLRSF